MNNSDNSENSSTDNSAKEVEGTQSSANFFETVKNFSLKEKITSARLSFNDTLKSLVPSEVIPKKEENMLDVVKRPLYECSEYSQQNFPYMSTVTRTHAPEIIGAYTTGMGLISLRYLPRKWAIVNTTAAFLSVGLITTLINFKWKFPKHTDN